MLVRTDNANYSAIAEALREKTGSNTKYTPAQMAEAIRNLDASGGGNAEYNLADQIATGSTSITLYGPTASFIADSAFNRWESVTAAIFPNVIDVNDYAFAECENLSLVSMPNAETVARYAFDGCPIVSLYLPALLDADSNELRFGENPSLETVDMRRLYSTTHGMFRQCYSLSSIMLDGCCYIGGDTFTECSSLTSMNLSLCRGISGGAFYGCESLSSVSFPVCEYIGYEAFAFCPTLGELDLPQCTLIDSSAFYACDSLSVVSIPNCTSLACDAFASCPSLEVLYITGVSSVTELVGYDAFSGTPFTEQHRGSIYVPPSLYSAFIVAEGWSTVSDRIVPYGTTGNVAINGTTLVLNGTEYSVSGTTLVINAASTSVSDTTITFGQAGTGLTVDGTTLVVHGADVSDRTLVMGSGGVYDGALSS